MGNLRLSLACATYDNRNRGIFDGVVKPEGIELTCIRFNNVDELFRRTLQSAEFDVSELSFSNYLHRQSVLPYIAIPVFTSRKFRHGDIFINTKSGIRSPADLNGKRIGCFPEYFVTAAVWQRGIFQHEFGLAPEKVSWFAEKPERFKVEFPSGVSVKVLPGIWQALESGNIDVTFGPRKPPNFQKSTSVKRLFANPREVETEYFRRTGIYPIMHVIVIKKDVWKQNRWIANSLIDAFTKSKQLWKEFQNVEPSWIGGASWIDLAMEEEEALGNDMYPYNLKDNRKTIETLIQYCTEQIIIQKPPTVEELFADNTI